MNLTDIWNTPGFFYAIGYSMSMAILLWHEKTEYGARRKWLAGIPAWLFFSVLMHLTNGSEGALYVFSMVAVVGGLLTCFYVNVKDAPRAAFLAVKAFIYGELSASLSWQIYYALAIHHAGLQNVAGLNAVMFGAFLLIGAVLWLGERALHRSGIEVIFSWRYVAIEFMIALSVYVISNLGYIAPDSPFSGSYARDIFAIRTLVDLSGAILIYSFHRQLIEVQRRLEKDALHNIAQMQYQAYQLSQESIDMVNRKYHDLKHQIALLKAEVAPGKAEAYLDQMEREIRLYEAQQHTGNAVLDAVLANKSAYCLNHGVQFKAIADGRALSVMDDMEIAALFGNMLDNAIESTERIADPQKRLVRLYVTSEKGFLRIRIENTCEERLRFIDGMPVTTKRDKRYHGFGMKSMRRTVEKHGGSIVADQRDDWFELKILIPLAPEQYR